MKYVLKEDAIGVDVLHNGHVIGRIDGAKASELDDEEIEELLFGDLEEGEFWEDEL